MLLFQQPTHPSSPLLMSPFKQLSSQSYRRTSRPQSPRSTVKTTPFTPGLLPISALTISRQPTHQQRPPSNPNTTRQSTPRQPRSAKPHERQQQHHGVSPSAKDRPTRNVSGARTNGHGKRQRQASPVPPSMAQPEQSNTVDKPLLHPTPVKSAPAIVSKGTAPGQVTAPPTRLTRRRKRASLPSSASAPDALAPDTAAEEAKDSKQFKESKGRKGSRAVPAPKIARERAFPKSQSVPTLPLSENRFPICDDNEEDLDLDRPSTPSPTGSKNQQALTLQIKSFFDSEESKLDDRGPQTAPLSGTSFTSNHFPGLAPPTDVMPARFDHKRTPSAPVDVFSFDAFSSELNDNSDSSDSARLSHPHSAHFAPLGVSRRFASTPPRKPVPAFNTYASSMFQCSPSPECLPKPSFSLASKKDMAL